MAKSSTFKIEGNTYLRLENLMYKLKYKSIEQIVSKSFTLMALLDEIEDSPCQLIFKDEKGKEHPISFYSEEGDVKPEEAKAEDTSEEAKAEDPLEDKSPKKVRAEAPTRKRTSKKRRAS